jgi:hypothetical protein
VRLQALTGVLFVCGASHNHPNGYVTLIRGPVTDGDARIHVDFRSFKSRFGGDDERLGVSGAVADSYERTLRH